MDIWADEASTPQLLNMDVWADEAATPTIAIYEHLGR